MGTAVVLTVLLLLAVLAVRALFRRKRKVRQDCAGCPMRGNSCGKNRCS